MNKTVYLDHAAATPAHPDVVEAMRPFFSNVYANPSALHAEGRKAKAALENARTRVANILGCESEEIVFTSGGTESVNLALRGYPIKHVITQTTEHHAVLHTIDDRGISASYANVNRTGICAPEEIVKNIVPDTNMVSCMYANNEIGTVQPIREITTAVKNIRENICVHTDACQAPEYLPIRVSELGVDLMSLNGSKIYGPKGVGLLYKKKSVKLKPIITGGGQEFGLRAGTENVAAIVGFAAALEIADKNRETESKRLTELQRYFIDRLMDIPNTMMNGDLECRLPNNVNCTFLNIEGESIVLKLDEAGISSSTGSACTTDTLEPSHVIIATGVPHEVAHGSVRFTMGRSTTKDDIDYTIEHTKRIVKELRAMSPVNFSVLDYVPEDGSIRYTV